MALPVPGEIVGPRRPSVVVSCPPNFTVRRGTMNLNGLAAAAAALAALASLGLGTRYLVAREFMPHHAKFNPPRSGP